MAEIATVARPYAKAAFEAAVSGEHLSLWETVLGHLAEVVEAPELAELIRSPSIETADKASQILSLLPAEQIPDGLSEFIGVLAENRRLAAIPAIHRQFEALKSERESYVDVAVETAFELEDGQQEEIAENLSDRLERKINLDTTVNSSLIGGVIIRAGDLVIDGSVRGRLNKLAEALTS